MSKKTRKNRPGPATGRLAREAFANPEKNTRGRTTVGNLAAAGASPAGARPKTLKTGARGATRVKSAGTAESLAEGAKAPAFRLPGNGGTSSLSDYHDKKLVLFFYPRADTPGCTKEAIDFSRLAPLFAKANTAVLGISADPPKAQQAFSDKHKLTVPLMSDEKHDMLQAYGAWGEKTLYGRSFMGIIRTTVLIGADGRIKRFWRKVRVDGHAEEVLEAARAT